MQSQIRYCSICALPYNQTDRLPRLMPKCPHTLCTNCLASYISKAKMLVCPYDNVAIHTRGISIDDFKIDIPSEITPEPVVPGENMCSMHINEPLRLICIVDKVKICDLCSSFGEHKGHEAVPMSENAGKVFENIKQLEQILKNVEDFSEGIENALEKKRESLYNEIQQRFKEIRWFLQLKELELLFETNSFFVNEKAKIKENLGEESQIQKNIASKISELQERMVSNQANTEDLPQFPSLFKQELITNKLRAFEDDINRVCESLKLQAIIDIQSMLLELQFPKEEFREYLNKFYLGVFEDGILDSNGKELSQTFTKDNNTRILTLNSTFTMDKGFLERMRDYCIRSHEYGFSEDTCTEIYLCWEQAKNCGNIKLDFSCSDIEDPELLQYNLILSWCPKAIRSLDICLEDCKLGDTGLVPLFDKSLCEIETLKNVNLHLRGTKITGETMKALTKRLLKKCKEIEEYQINLSKTMLPEQQLSRIFYSMKQLRIFKVNLNSTMASNMCIEALVKALGPEFNKLECFELKLYESQARPESLIKLFRSMEKLKRLCLVLSNTSTSNHVLIEMVKGTLASVEKLEEFELHLGSTNVGDEGLELVLDHVKTVKSLVLNFSGTKVSNKSMKPFLETRLPEMLYLENIELHLFASKVTEGVRKKVSKYIEKFHLNKHR